MPRSSRTRRLVGAVAALGLLLPAGVVHAAPSDDASTRVLVHVPGGAAAAARAMDGVPGAGALRHAPRTGLSVVEVRPGHDPAGLARALSRRPGVRWAEPDQVVHAADLADLVDDPYADEQWGLDNTGQRVGGRVGVPGVDIGAVEAWTRTRGRADVVVAVLDTGVDITHPDLRDRIWTNPGEVPGNGRDDDGNGHVDDVHGWDFRHGDGTVFDTADGEEHGTHIAGTIAATTDNGRGVAGVAPGVTVMPLKFMGPDGSGRLSDAVLAVEYAAAAGADVLNASWGSDAPSRALEQALTAFDGVVVAAAGNEGADLDASPVYPAAYDLDHLVAVTAVRADGTLPGWANHGARTVDLGAPGAAILSTVPGGYAGMDGTSMAAPHVAGVAALARSVDVDTPAGELVAALQTTARPLAALATTTSSGGMADAAALLAHLDGASTTTAPTPTTATPSPEPTPTSEPTTTSPTPAPSPDPTPAPEETTSPAPAPEPAPDPTPTPDEPSPGQTPEEDEPAPDRDDVVTLPSRLAGADRYTTAAAITRAAFPTTVDDVHLATGAGFADALAGTAAAGRREGPVLLTPPDHLPAAVADEIDRLQPRRIWVLGGTAAISDDVVRVLARTGATVRRLAGPDRHATSAVVSARTFAPGVPVAYVATGRDFPDALAAGAAAGRLGGPLLLTDRDHLPTAVAAELTRLAPRRLVVLGGPNAVAEAVRRAAGDAAGVGATRVGGATRYDTAAAVVADAFPDVTRTVMAATGTAFPDALSGGAAGARIGAPVVLVPPTGPVPAEVAAAVRRLRPDLVVALGGTSALPEATVATLRRAAR